MEAQNVDGDGWCMFSAISFALHGDMQQSQQVVDALVAYLESEEGRGLAPFRSDSTEDGKAQTWDEYLQKLQAARLETGLWAGELELAGLSRALGRTIEVYYRTGNLAGRYESGRPGPGEPIRLLYDRQFPMLPAEKDERNHYLCITKMPEG